MQDTLFYAECFSFRTFVKPHFSAQGLRVVSVKTIGRIIDVVENCMAESTVCFLLLSQFNFHAFYGYQNF